MSNELKGGEQTRELSQDITIYRIEHKKDRNGMWYSKNGEYDPFIMKLTDGKSKHIPMKHDPKYRKFGLNWHSGCQSVEVLSSWFSKQDIEEMLQAGYGLYRIKARQVMVEESQILFTQESVVSRCEIELSSIWNNEHEIENYDFNFA